MDLAIVQNRQSNLAGRKTTSPSKIKINNISPAHRAFPCYQDSSTVLECPQAYPQTIRAAQKKADGLTSSSAPDQPSPEWPRQPLARESGAESHQAQAHHRQTQRPPAQGISHSHERNQPRMRATTMRRSRYRKQPCCTSFARWSTMTSRSMRAASSRCSSCSRIRRC